MYFEIQVVLLATNSQH